MEATVSALPGPVRHFAFEVPSGYYAYSGFNGARLAQDATAFAAAEASVVYVGDFVYGRDCKVALRRNLDGLNMWMNTQAPNFGKAVEVAETVPVRPPNIFVCTP